MLYCANELPSFDVSTKVNLPWLFKNLYCIDKTNKTAIYLSYIKDFVKLRDSLTSFSSIFANRKKEVVTNLFVQLVLISTVLF